MLNINEMLFVPSRVLWLSVEGFLSCFVLFSLPRLFWLVLSGLYCVYVVRRIVFIFLLDVASIVLHYIKKGRNHKEQPYRNR